MKTLIILLTIFSPYLRADISNCQHDAQFHGTDSQLLTQTAECHALMLAHPETKKIVTKDGKISIHALGNMIYVITPEDQGLVAGDQTRLSRVSALALHEEAQLLIVYQNLPQGSNVLLFKLGDIGNISPWRYQQGQIFNELSEVKLHHEQKELELISLDRKQSTFIWSEADSRYAPDQPELSPRIIRIIRK